MRILISILLLLLPLFAGVGKIIYIKGKVSIQRDSKLQPATVGMLLEQKDTVLTEKASVVKLLFKDNSAISLGGKSDFNIDEYFFDGTKDSVAKFKVKRGIFRIITGKIAKVMPSNFKLKTKTTTISIRGTIFSGIVTKKGEEWFCEKGVIYARSKGVSIDVQKGYSTKIKYGKTPTKPKKYKSESLKKLMSRMTGWKNKRFRK
jgi:hypothetical protein